ncbi:hypothetical protein J4423_00095 [Candidatus Pacearchaeota archaeon]|nr:hypothetical protein [Candidatus Pacearchaeota archaeon]
MARPKPLNKFYLGAAFGVSLSTVSCPFLVDYSVHNRIYRNGSFGEPFPLQENPLPYVLGGICMGLAFACRFNENAKSSKSVMRSENSCLGRVPIEELLDADELEIKK